MGDAGGMGDAAGIGDGGGITERAGGIIGVAQWWVLRPSWPPYRGW